MPTKICLVAIGLVYLFFGICGFFPSLVAHPPAELGYYQMTMIGHWGYFFTWLPVNPVHDVIYVVIGALAVLTSIFQFVAIVYARLLFFLLVCMIITGLLPFGIAHLWGLCPLFSWNIMLHTVTAVLLYYYGFIYPLDLGGNEPASQMDVLQV